jgi:hypothetical protein
MKEVRRFWLAAAFAPLSVPAWYVLTIFFSAANFGNSFVGYVATIAVVSYAGFFVIGLPFALILRAKGKLTFAALLVGSLLAGPLFLVLMQVLSVEPVTFHGSDVQLAISFTVLSVTVAMVFGLIAKVRIH